MPSQVNPQPQGDPRTDVDYDDPANADPGSEDEAIAAFNQRRQSKAQSQSDDAPADDADEGADDPEAEQAEPDDDADPTADLVEVTFEGKPYTVPPEIKDALLRKADYSRSMNAVAEVKKDYAQRVETAERLIENAEKLAEAKAEVRAIDAQIKQFEAIDFDALEAADPARASVTALRLMQLQRARDLVASKEQSIAQSLAADKQKDHDAKVAEMVKTLEAKFPGWGDEAGAKVSKYAIEAGWTPSELRTLTDPRVVLILEKARKFDAIQTGKQKAIAEARQQAQPMARPGAPRRANPATDAQTRFSKSKSPDDAVALFEARAGAKGRR